MMDDREKENVFETIPFAKKKSGIRIEFLTNVLFFSQLLANIILYKTLDVLAFIVQLHFLSGLQIDWLQRSA